jgi:hypothetical protein
MAGESKESMHKLGWISKNKMIFNNNNEKSIFLSLGPI